MRCAILIYVLLTYLLLSLVNAADVVLVIRRDRVDIYCNPINYVYLLPLIAHWRRLRIHCLPQAQVTTVIIVFNNHNNNNNNGNNNDSVSDINNKKLSYRRETARQLPTWRGLSPQSTPPPPLATPMRTVESETLNKRTSSMPSVKRTLS